MSLLSSKNSNSSTTFSLNMGGQSMRQIGTVKVEAPVLQEFETENGLKKFVGDPIKGDEAMNIAYSYIEANKERKLEAFKTAVDKAASIKDFVKKDRSLKDGESVTDRAKRWIAGTILGAINTVPSTFTVGGKHYAYSKISNSKMYDPYDLQDVLTGAKSIGLGETITSIEDADGIESTNMMIVPKDLLQDCIKYFVEKLEVKIEGNSVYILGTEAVSFTKGDQNAKIVSAAKYKLSEIDYGF